MPQKNLENNPKKPDFTPTPAQQKLYDSFVKLFRINNRIRFVDVDFDKPFWHLFGKYKGKIGFYVFAETLLLVFENSMPFLISYSIASRNFEWLIYIAIAFIALKPLDYLSAIFGNLLGREIGGSVLVSSSKFFLEVDPMFYATKSTGQIISKVNRGSSNISSLLTMVGYSIFFTLIGLVSSIGFIFNNNRIAGFVAFIAIAATFLFYTIISYQNRKTFTKKSIKDADKFSATNIETLGQLAYIRSLFASEYQHKKVVDDLKQSSESGFLTGAFFVGLFHFSNIFIGVGFLVLVLIFTDLIKNGQIATEIALACIYSYVSNASSASRIGDKIQQFQTQMVEINDLWDFIKNFGKQTFPVMGERLKEKLEEKLENGVK